MKTLKIMKILKNSSQTTDDVMVLTQGSEVSDLALYFFTSCFNHLLSKHDEYEDKIKWERDQIVHSTNRTTFPLPDFMGKDCIIHHTCH